MEYIKKDDCVIRRYATTGQTEMSVVVNNEGDVVFRVYGPDWSDSKIWKVLSLMNDAYEKGHEAGMDRKSLEIRKALNLD